MSGSIFQTLKDTCLNDASGKNQNAKESHLKIDSE